MVLYFTFQRHAQVIEKNKIENLDKNEDFLKKYTVTQLKPKFLYSKKIILPSYSLLHKSWELRNYLQKVSNKNDRLIKFGLRNGASGVKL